MRPIHHATAAVVAVAVVSSGLRVAPVLAEIEQTGPAPQCSKDFCVQDEQTTSATPATPVRVSTGSSEPADCVWRSEPPAGFDPTGGPSTYFELEGEQTAEAYVVYEFCGNRFSGRMQWVTPAGPAPLPSAGELAQTVYARLEGDLPAPTLATDPEVDEPAIISVPTFVEVTNWTGTVSDQECDPSGALCVAVEATPALSFAPGEPGAETVDCTGAGTRFADGAHSGDQASMPGACAYAYRLRTGTAGRPAAWLAEVTVTWTLTWESTTGETGVLPDVVKSAGVERSVNEIQTVVER